ncbi:MAG: hypothetical protein VX278_15220, partial [Myxococcota bacterium]|nr:hypothetical protein [Myxococcota bacterium]
YESDYPNDAKFSADLKKLLFDAQRKEGEEPEEWEKRIDSLDGSLKDSVKEADEREEERKQKEEEERKQKEEEERKQKEEEERRKLAEERKRFEERKRQLEEERKRLDAERKKREEEKKRKEEHAESKALCNQFVLHAREYERDFLKDELFLQSLNELILSAEEREEESPSDWKARLEVCKENLKKLILEAEQREEEERKRKEEEERKRKEEEERKQKEEEERKRKEEEERKRKEEEERKQKEEEERRKREEERKNLELKTPRDLKEALQIFHTLHTLGEPEAEDKLKPFIFERLPNEKKWLVSLIRELCFERDLVKNLFDQSNFEDYYTNQCNVYNPQNVKIVILLMCSVLDMSPPPLLAPKRKKTEQTTSPSDISNVPGQGSAWNGPAQSELYPVQAFEFSGSPQSFQLMRGSGSPAIRFKTSEKTSSASTIGFLLINKILPLRTDLNGMLIGWYRFKQNKNTISGTTSMGDLNTKIPLEIQTVENKAQLILISVPEMNIRKHSTVGSAVPFLNLQNMIQGWLQLPAANWEIYLNEERAEPYSILLDYSFQGVPLIELRSKS